MIKKSKFKANLKKNSPAIFVGISIVGLIGSVVLTARQTSKAKDNLEVKKQELAIKENKKPEEVKFTAKEIVKFSWKYYIPVAATTTVSVISILGSYKELKNRNAAWATAYTLSETARQELKKQIIETVGEKKAQEIDDSLAKKTLDKAPVANSSNIQDTGKGNTLCFDKLSGRYFRCDISTIKHVINKLNDKLLNEHWVPANDYYYYLTLDEIGDGDYKGWQYFRDGLISPSYSSILDKNDEPCLVIDFLVAPRDENIQ